MRGEDEEGGVGKVPKPNRTVSPPALAHLHQVGAVELDEGQQHEEGHHGNVLRMHSEARGKDVRQERNALHQRKGIPWQCSVNAQ